MTTDLAALALTSALAVAKAPETLIWAMVMTSFGGLGAMLRADRRLAAVRLKA